MEGASRATMSVERLHADLTRLRAGAGLQAPSVRERVGTELRRACGVLPADADAVIRAKVSEVVIALIGRLTPEDARAVRAALNLDPEFRSRFIKGRMAALATAIDRDPRTAVRRVDDAFHLLAELLDATPVAQRPSSRFAPGGWYFDALRSTLEVDGDRLRLTERRRITSTIEGLDRITVGWSTERTAEYDSAFGVELLDGGDLVPDLERIKDGTWVGMVHLPAPLASGQSHDFCTRVTQTGRMEPYYIVTPFRRTERFEVRVIFAAGPTPTRAWRIVGEPARFADELNPDREVLEVDADGQLTSVFEQLDIGLSYGLRWSVGGS